MQTKQCERCKSEMAKEDITLGSESTGKKLLFLYRCNACGRVEYVVADIFENLLSDVA